MHRAILEGKYQPGDTVHADAGPDGQLVFSRTAGPAPAAEVEEEEELVGEIVS